MANTFKSFGSATIGTGVTSVYTVPSATQAVLLGITCANVVSSTVNVTVTIVKASGTYNIVKTAPVLVGSAIEVIGGGSKFIAEAADIIKVVSDTAASIDAIVSMLEIA